jgi:hypothetical protein
MTLVLIVNAVLMVTVFAAVIAYHTWSILTQHRDRPYVFATETARRRSPARTAEPRPAYSRSATRPGRAWPAS